MLPPFYPINEFGPAMPGLVIGTLGIVHVFLAQFAIGGGLLMCYFQWLDHTGRSRHARQFVDGYFRFLVLVSFVVGAVTGVGMWFTSIQVSPRTIGLMVDAFHWLWGVEWTFFCLEIVAGYCFYRYGKRLGDRERFQLLVLYATAAWFSLFWINGILSWQLTPGDWPLTRDVWDGFFNPSFFPSLIFRTVTSMAIASLVAMVVINFMSGLDRDGRTELIHLAARFLAPMLLMPVLAVWYFMSIPADSRSWVLGGSIAMTMFLGITAGASALIGAYAFFGLLRQKLYVNAATASLLCTLAVAATGGGEFVREGIRKPFTVRGVLYSNAITPAEMIELRSIGCTTVDPFPLRDAGKYPTRQLLAGATVYRFQCSVCHTIDAANGLVHLTRSWTMTQKRLNIAQLQRTKPFMPPFAGNAADVEALVQLLTWRAAGSPSEWPESQSLSVLAEISDALAEVGTKPATEPFNARESR